jgi:spermidine synthase
VGAEAPSPAEVVARADGVLGELVLRRRLPPVGSRNDAVYELISGGVFLMDSGDATTERLLAEKVLAELPGTALRVLVGGLGLGFTVAAVLADPRVTRLVVVEIEPTVTGWLRSGVVPAAQGLLDDDRITVVHADVTDALPAQPPGSLHAILLDVDNGPGFLTHPSNAALYDTPALRAAAATLAPGGVLAIWSADRSAELLADLDAAVGPARELRVPVRRVGRQLEYVLYLASVGGAP